MSEKGRPRAEGRRHFILQLLFSGIGRPRVARRGRPLVFPETLRAQHFCHENVGGRPRAAPCAARAADHPAWRLPRF